MCFVEEVRFEVMFDVRNRATAWFHDMFIFWEILFSGVSISFEDKDTKPIAKNIQNSQVLTKEHEITSLAWGDPDEVDVLIGMSCQRVKIYDTDFKAFTSSVDATCGYGSIRGLSRYKE